MTSAPMKHIATAYSPTAGSGRPASQPTTDRTINQAVSAASAARVA